MSQAEYFSRPFPLVAKLASLLRNNAAVQFVFARFAGLRRSNKSSNEPLSSNEQLSSDAPLVSPFLGEPPSVEETPSPGELPGLGEAPSLGEIPNHDEKPDPDAMPGGGNAEPPPAAPARSDEPAATVELDQPAREKLIRRRWAETGIKMWSAGVQGAGHAALTIQGSADLLPAKPGATRREYDRLEFKLIAGQIVCEGVIVAPPQRWK